MKTVKNLNTLKGMERKGLIKFNNQTGTKIEGLYSSKKFTCYYVEWGLSSFEYKNKKYMTKYFDGCFFPYIIELTK